MEVHPPHHPLNTWRDFLIHIATITIGLLIAIGLEQSVELLHHRHILQQARENIRREIEVNEADARSNLGYIQSNADNMKANIQKAQALRENPRALDHGEMHFTFSWNSFSESAWLSARDSGALTYMPADEVQKYADAYLQQDLINRQAVEIFTHQSDLAAPLISEPDASPIPREEAQTLLQGCAVTYMHLLTLHQLIDELDKLYLRTLKA